MVRGTGPEVIIDEAAALDAVRRSLRAALADAPWPLAFHDVAAEVLAEPARALGGRLTPWAAIPLRCCAAICGDWRPALPAAVAAELYMTALDLCDDIEDGDHSGAIACYGMPVALNLSTGLLALAHAVLQAPAMEHAGAVAAGSPVPDAGARAAAALWHGLAEATGGQHLDLATAGGAALSVDACLEIARRKSGALVEACCRAGAAYGTAEAGLIDLFGALGRHLGLVAQLDNDMHDAGSTADGAKSDLARRKQTVPIAVARASIEPADLHTAVWQGGVQLAYALIHAERARAAEALEVVTRACPDPARARAALDPLLAPRTAPFPVLAS